MEDQCAKTPAAAYGFAAANNLFSSSFLEIFCISVWSTGFDRGGEYFGRIFHGSLFISWPEAALSPVLLTQIFHIGESFFPVRVHISSIPAIQAIPWQTPAEKPDAGYCLA